MRSGEINLDCHEQSDDLVGIVSVTAAEMVVGESSFFVTKEL